ncbi:hypothetical protein A4A49_04356 [Nicotiana attenuata]|uniref:Uncharacterized protein n=1 Tax=Nicotiana attenuata TaxID=49451 RepID=A0A1J6ILN9_NICAT|nr:hypothetical protein A4A49_04356 [Nicotiana attenuata]
MQDIAQNFFISSNSDLLDTLLTLYKREKNPCRRTDFNSLKIQNSQFIFTLVPCIPQAYSFTHCFISFWVLSGLLE